MAHHSMETSTLFEMIKNLENMLIGPGVKMRQTGAVAEKCLDQVQDQLTSIRPLLGKTFGYGFLYRTPVEHQAVTREVVSLTPDQHSGLRVAEWKVLPLLHRQVVGLSGLLGWGLWAGGPVSQPLLQATVGG